MGIRDLFAGGGRRKKTEEAITESLTAYSGMRVEVLGEDGALLFVARLSVSPGGLSQLQQLSNGAVPTDAEPFPATLRGYQENQRIAVHMSGRVSWVSDKIWRVDQLRITGKNNDRAFFRQGIDTAGEFVPIGRAGAGKASCEVLNISAGGVCVRTGAKFEMGDKLLLVSRLLPDQNTPPLPCEVRRISKRRGVFEYGCKFLDLNPATEDLIAKAIVKLQMKQLRR